MLPCSGWGCIPSDQLDDWVNSLSPADFDALTSAVAQLPRNNGGEGTGYSSIPGAIGLGGLQTAANAAQDIQDGVVGIMNLPLMFFNGSFWLQEQVGLFDDAGRFQYYQSPQWSLDLFVHEDPLAREINKTVAGAVLGAGVAKATKFLKPVVTKVDDAAGEAVTVTFKHGERHLKGSGLSQSSVEAAITRKVQALGPQMGDHTGWINVDGRWILYRAKILPNGTVNVGTYWPVEGILGPKLFNP